MSLLNDLEQKIQNILNEKNSIYYYDFGDAGDELEKFVKTNSLLCSQNSMLFIDKNYGLQYCFLHGMADAIEENKEIDWRIFIEFIEILYKQHCKKYDSHAYMVLIKSAWIIKDSLNKNYIDKKYNKKIQAIINYLINLGYVIDRDIIKNPADNSDISYNDLYDDPLTTSLNDISGMSFHILFAYVSQFNNQYDKNSLSNYLKTIIQKYLDEKYHTSSHNVVIGLHMNLIFDIDEKWGQYLISRITQVLKLKLSFWHGCIVNHLYEINMDNMYLLYDEFLNSNILDDHHDKEIYKGTLDHVILGYFHSIKYCELILKKFLNNVNPDIINHIIYYVTQIISQPKIFDDKIKYLWNNKFIIKHGDLERWFRHSKLPKNITINLFLNYLKNTNNNGYVFEATFDELKKYIIDYPDETLSCIKIIYEKKKFYTDYLINFMSNISENKIKNHPIYHEIMFSIHHYKNHNK